MYSVMKKLISKKFYDKWTVAQDKLDVFFAVGRIDEAQYTELTVLVEELYPITAEE